MKAFSWSLWVLVSAAILGYFGWEMIYEKQKPNFLPGAVSHGHYQIELACDACHTEPFGGGDVLQQACVNCHDDELKTSLDSHPRKKFTDPRNAALLEILDARYCTSCHLEHQASMISDMGVSLPKDYCFHCHQEIGEDRESHKDLTYESCQSAGCHNYHDNRALYENFLEKHLDDPDHLTSVTKPADFYGENIKQLKNLLKLADHPLNEPDADIRNNESSNDPSILNQWSHSSHAAAGVNCSQCHGQGEAFVASPPKENCANCHEAEHTTFLKGKHGMRQAADLEAMTPQHSKLPMKDTNSSSLGCNSCHKAHAFETRFASVEACISCHNDQHTQNYKMSKHYELYEMQNDKGVSCATCHMPKVEMDSQGIQGTRIQHNQNDTLRPNEKMIRPVCLNCHGLQFSLNALADKALIERNFNGLPNIHVESLDWVRKRHQGDNEKGLY